MGFRKYIRNGIGLAGKAAMGYLNSASGGLAGQVLDRATNFVDKHSGVIGKVAKSVGKNFLDDETRNKMSNYADRALKYIPEGKIRTALSKINNVAQGRDANYKPKGKKSIGNMNLSTITNAAKKVANVATSAVKSTQPIVNRIGNAATSAVKSTRLGNAAATVVKHTNPIAYNIFSRVGKIFGRGSSNDTPSETPRATPTVPTTAPQVLKAKRKII